MTYEEIKTWKELNELERVKYWRKFWHDSDLYLDVVGDDETDYNAYSRIYGRCRKGTNIWVPPLFELILPERSLIGIYVTMLVEYYDGDWEDKAKLVRWAREETGRIIGQSYRPDIALAKAIIERCNSEGGK